VEEFLNTIIESAGEAISGGCYTTANTTGGPPHFSVGLAVNVVGVEATKPTGEEETVTNPLPLPVLVGNVGLFPGLSLGPTVGGVGGVDAQVRFGMIPSVADIDDGATIVGVGAKLGLLRDSITMPAASLSVSWTKMSQLGFVFEPVAGGEVKPQFELSTLSMHFDVSKNLVFFTPYAGVGWSKHTLDSEFTIDVAGYELVSESYSTDTSTTRFYGGLELGLLLMRLNLEGGKAGDHAFFASSLSLGL
jgi:hypothetical protein